MDEEAYRKAMLLSAARSRLHSEKHGTHYNGCNKDSLGEVVALMRARGFVFSDIAVQLGLSDNHARSLYSVYSRRNAAYGSVER